MRVAVGCYLTPDGRKSTAKEQHDAVARSVIRPAEVSRAVASLEPDADGNALIPASACCAAVGQGRGPGGFRGPPRETGGIW